MKHRADHIQIKEINTDIQCQGIIIRFTAKYENKEVELHTYLPNYLAAQLIGDLGNLLNDNLYKLNNMKDEEE